MKIRIEGQLDEINKAVIALHNNFHVGIPSKPYQNRGRSTDYRVYVNVALKSELDVVRNDRNDIFYP